jgi:hypothetical protein
MKRYVLAVVMGVVILMGGAQAGAQDGWELEISPYVWFAGIEGDVTVGGQTASVDMDFGDLFDAVDAAFCTVVEAQNGQWFVGGQFDFIGLDSDNLDDAPQGGRVEMDSVIFTAGGGYTFDLPLEGSTIGIGVGVRHMNMDVELTIRGPVAVSQEGDKDLTDAVLILRPSLVINDRLRFNPAITIGAGDSDFTYDAWPNFQYRFNDRWHGRVGYRMLHYEIESDNEAVEFDGDFSGLFVAAGVTL